MKNNNGNNRNKNNHKANRKHLARKQRHRNHSVLLKRTALNNSVVSQMLPTKSCSPPNQKKIGSASASKHWKPKAAGTSKVTPASAAGASISTDINEKKQPVNSVSNIHRSFGIHRWHNNPRITGAVAAVLLFTMLAVAIIPISLSVRAEEQSEAAALNPTMQLAKEYIYAGSRMLAIEDYGLTSSTPTPTATPTATPETPTPTPETPTPTPETPTPTPETPTPTPEPPTPTPTPEPEVECYITAYQQSTYTVQVSWSVSPSRPASTDKIQVVRQNDPSNIVYEDYASGGTGNSIYLSPHPFSPDDYIIRYMKNGSVERCSNYFSITQ